MKKIISSCLSSLLVVSSIIGGGVCFRADSSIAFAEGNEGSGTLEPGTYTATLARRASYNSTESGTAYSLHFSGNAILNIDDNNNQTITIGVENWSLYDVFIPRKQTYVSEGVSVIPSAVFDTYSSEIEHLSTLDSNIKIDDSVDGWYDYSTDKNLKYGNVSVDYYDSKTDVAYVTFSIDDYQKRIVTCAWLSRQNQKASYLDFPCFDLDSSSIVRVDSMKTDDSCETWSNKITLATARKNTTSDVDYGNRLSVNTAGANIPKSVFDDAYIENKNGKYEAKFHVYTGGKTYKDFKILTSVSHTYGTRDDWDILMTGTFEDLEVSEDGFITVTYDSLEEAWLGKYIYFDTAESSSTTNYYCMESLIPVATEDFTLEDESGVYITSNTAYKHKTMQLDVEVDRALQETDNKSFRLNMGAWNSSLFLEPKYYTVYLKDVNGNLLGDTSNVNLYVPLPKDYDSSTYYYQVLDANGNSIGSSNSSVSIVIDEEKGYLTFTDLYMSSNVVNGYTFAFMKYADTSNVFSIDKNVDAIYRANAYFIHESQPGTLSMSDAGIANNREVYIIVKDNAKKMYFKADEVIDGAYIGDIYCNNIEVSGGVYEDSVEYTDFLVDSDGNIVSNFGYDAYMEYGCIKGGILTLLDNSYIKEENAYSLAIASPVMMTLTGTPVPYSSYTKDDLRIWLVFTDLEDVTDSITLEEVEKEYGYKESAVIRQREIAKLKLAEVEEYEGLYEYPESAVYNLNKAIADADKATDSASYEKAIKALKTATEKAEPMTTSSIVNGYTLGLQDDFSLSFCMDFKSAATPIPDFQFYRRQTSNRRFSHLMQVYVYDII